MYLTVAMRSLFRCFPNGGIRGVILKILHLVSSVNTRRFNLTETEKRGSNLGGLCLGGKEQVWRVAIRYWIGEYERAEGWT